MIARSCADKPPLGSRLGQGIFHALTNRRLAFALSGHYFGGVSSRTNLKKPANLRSWRVIIIRSKGEYLGSVEAPDRERAAAVAIKQF
jgi:hypothetical protein